VQSSWPGSQDPRFEALHRRSCRLFAAITPVPKYRCFTARDPIVRHTTVLRPHAECRKRRPLCRSKAVMAFDSRADIPTPHPKVRTPAYRPGASPVCCATDSTPKRRCRGRRTPGRQSGLPAWSHDERRKRHQKHHSWRSQMNDVRSCKPVRRPKTVAQVACPEALHRFRGSFDPARAALM